MIVRTRNGVRHAAREINRATPTYMITACMILVDTDPDTTVEQDAVIIGYVHAALVVDPPVTCFTCFMCTVGQVAHV